MDSMRTNPAHAMIAPMRFGNNFENVRTVIDTLMPATGIAMADILFLTSSLDHLIRLLFGSAILTAFTLALAYVFGRYESARKRNEPNARDDASRQGRRI